jgi:hypothetical protein
MTIWATFVLRHLEDQPRHRVRRGIVPGEGESRGVEYD